VLRNEKKKKKKMTARKIGIAACGELNNRGKYLISSI